VLPNFLIIGAARCGTTTVYRQLQVHPDVYLPADKRPEPHFFFKDQEFRRGLTYYEERYFANWRGEHAVGEASTSYVFGPHVPVRVRAALPSAKFICLLRNPVDRAFSSYWHTRRAGLETLCFEEAIAQEQSRKQQIAGTELGEIAPFAYVERGFYYRQLVHWLQQFDRPAIKIVVFEDFLQTPDQVLSEIARFIGIAPEWPRLALQAENKSVPADTDMSSEMRMRLCEVFRDDIEALETLLGRSLRDWLKPRGGQC